MDSKKNLDNELLAPYCKRIIYKRAFLLFVPCFLIITNSSAHFDQDDISLRVVGLTIGLLFLFASLYEIFNAVMFPRRSYIGYNRIVYVRKSSFNGARIAKYVLWALFAIPILYVLIAFLRNPVEMLIAAPIALPFLATIIFIPLVFMFFVAKYFTLSRESRSVAPLIDSYLMDYFYGKSNDTNEEYTTNEITVIKPPTEVIEEHKKEDRHDRQLKRLKQWLILLLVVSFVTALLDLLQN